MNMSPIKKIVLGLAAVTVVVALITANNMASVMLIVASRENGTATQQVQSNATVQNPAGSTGSSGTATGNTVTGNTATGNTATGNTATGNTATNDSANTGTQNNTSDKNTSTDKPAADDKAPVAPSGKFTDQQIVDMYNKAVNNAKAKATKVIRVKDGATNYNGIVEAGALSSAASTLMGMFMVGSKEEIEAKNEEWVKEKLPPENAQAALTVAGISSAECKEEGDYYIVTIKGKDEVNPKSGGPGVGSLCGVIQEETITGSISSVPGLSLSNISIAYENVTTVAKIEKSTGNLVALTVDAPCILQLSAKLLVASIDNAKVGIGVYTEYTIAY